MTYLFKAVNPNKSYKSVVKTILESGQKIAPRGQTTFELQPAIHHIEQPQKKLCSVPGRKANPFFNMAENMWILGGHGNIDWICTFNNKLAEFQADTGHDDFNAPYGRRIRFYNRHRSNEVKLNPYNSMSIKSMPQVDQLEHCYRSLKSDPASRQAVVTLWNPIFDYYFNKTKDRPCNTTIYFKIRDGKLNMTVSNRSNDIHLGLYGVNFVQFGHIQEFMAAALNVQIGHYVHLSDSLHIYENSPHSKSIIDSDYDFDIYDYVEPKILNYDEFKKETDKNDPSLGDFLQIADQVISDNIEFRKYFKFVEEGQPSLYDGISPRDNGLFKYSRSNYAKSCSKYLMSYDFFKIKKYEQAMRFIMSVFEDGFKDWAILGLEFFMRSNSFKSWLESVNSNSNNDFINTLLNQAFDVKVASHVAQYINKH